MSDPRFIASEFPNGRILLRCGQVDVGAVFPPLGEGQHRYPWAWRLWLNGKPWAQVGAAKTEQAAKNALLAAFRDFLARADLQVIE